MSNRVTWLREVLAELLAASRAGEPLDAAWANADKALAGTSFVSPRHFPHDAVTRDGRPAKIFGVHAGRLIGVCKSHGTDDFDVQVWEADGTLFGPADPSITDLVVPEVDA